MDFHAARFGVDTAHCSDARFLLALLDRADSYTLFYLHTNDKYILKCDYSRKRL